MEYDEILSRNTSDTIDTLDYYFDQGLDSCILEVSDGERVKECEITKDQWPEMRARMVMAASVLANKGRH